MKRFIAILFFICVYCFSYSQREGGLQSLFDANEKPEEIYFQGVLNGIHQINISLGVSNGVCKGYYSYIGSKLTFQLEGNVDNNSFDLQELDQNLNVSAHILLHLKDNLLTGEWSHMEKEISFPMSARKVENFSYAIKDCQNNSWQKIYYGVLENNNISIRLTKEADSDLFVNMNIANIPFDFVSSCETAECRFFKQDFGNQTGLFEELEFRRIDSSFLNITLIKSDRSKKLVSLRLDETLDYDCIDYSSYVSRYDLIYPKLKNLFFNKHISAIVKQWENKVAVQIDSVESINPGVIPSDRFTFEANGWVDILHFENKLISGIFTFQNNWSRKSEQIPFSFDLRNNKEIEIQNVFKSSFDYKSFLNTYIEEQKKNYLPFQEKYISEWLKNENFDNLTMTDDGIILSSSFSNIFGTQYISLPYVDIKKHLQKDFKKQIGIQ